MATYNLGLLVEEKIQKWQKRHRNDGMKLPRLQSPILTISRQHGARGEEVGKLLANRLDFDYWDREVLHAMAEHAHVSETLLESLDEHPKDTISEMVRAIWNSAEPSQSDYMNELHRQVRDIAHDGHAIIMGRGSQLIVAPRSALRVRLVAPLDDRVVNLAQQSGATTLQARSEIARIDQIHADFIRENWSKSIDDPTLYDLVGNTSALGVEGTANIIIKALHERFEHVAPN